MAIFTSGTQVRLKFTGDIGIITDLLSEEMVTVRLSDGDEIPVALENLVRLEGEGEPASQPKTPQLPDPKPANSQTQKPPPPIRPADWEAPMREYIILNSKGIQLCFEPHLRADGTPKDYTVYLINDTAYDVIFTYRMVRKNNAGYKSHGKLDSVTVQEVDQISFDDLNEMPEVRLECWQLTTLGTGPQLEATIKIKPKTFFKSKQMAPILNRDVHWFLAFDHFEPKKQKKTKDNLQSYTKQHIEAINWEPLQETYRNSVNDVAHFNNEIDLHIEHHVSTVKGKSNQEILYIQMEVFRNFLSRAIELGISPVFVIHGVGKGRLKDHVAKELRENHLVKGFKNEYHHKYGWGATEVWF